MRANNDEYFKVFGSITLDSLGIAISQLLADVLTVSEGILIRDQQVTCSAVQCKRIATSVFEVLGRTTFRVVLDRTNHYSPSF
jgi:hypothetical protein